MDVQRLKKLAVSFFVFIFSLLITLAARAERWTAVVTVTSADPSFARLICTFGVDSNATDGFDSGLDAPAPPASPGGGLTAAFDAEPLNLMKDIRAEGPWTLKVSDSLNSFTLSWNVSAVPNELGISMYTGDGSRIDMRAKSSHAFAAGSYQIVIVTLPEGLTLNVYRGINMITPPLEDEGIRKVRDILLRLQEDREDPNDFIIWYDRENGRFASYRLNFPEDSRANKEVVAGESYILVASEDGRITFRGNTWGGGRMELPVYRGINMLCPPVDDPGISNVRDILLRLQENRANPNDFIIWYNRGNRRFVAYRMDFPSDSPANKEVEGGEGYILIASEDGNITFEGEGWQNSSGTLASPTMPLASDKKSATN